MSQCAICGEHDVDDHSTHRWVDVRESGVKTVWVCGRECARTAQVAIRLLEIQQELRETRK